MKKKIYFKTNWIVLITIVIYELFLIFFLFIFSYGFIVDAFCNDYFSYGDLFAIIVMFFLILLILNVIMWQIRGYEIIEMNDKVLIIRKKGKLFSTQNLISLFEIEKIQVKNYETTIYNLFFKILGTKGGKINIQYLGQNIYVGQNLTDTEAQEYVNQMNTILSNYTHSVMK